MMVLIDVIVVIAVLIGAFALYLLVVAWIPGWTAPEQILKPVHLRTAVDRPDHAQPRQDVSFTVRGISVRAWLYLPRQRSGSVPCVVMAHGLGATKEAGLESYAVRFQEARLAVLVFDYRHLGDSGGEPRQLVWIPYQLEDTRAAVAYARGLEEVDSTRVALWGTSLSAGHAIVAAARDMDIACVVAQCPLLNGGEAGLELLKREGLKTLRRMFRLLPHGQRDLVRSWFRLSPHRIPLVGRQNSVAVLADDRAWTALEQLAPDGFINQVCARIVIRLDKYRPVRHVSKVRCPVLLQISNDEVAYQAKAVKRVRKRLKESAEVVHYPVGHFDMYLGQAFEISVRDQVAFLKRHLLKDSSHHDL